MAHFFKKSKQREVNWGSTWQIRNRGNDKIIQRNWRTLMLMALKILSQK